MAVLAADSGEGDLHTECDEDNIIKAVQVCNIDRFYIFEVVQCHGELFVLEIDAVRGVRAAAPAEVQDIKAHRTKKESKYDAFLKSCKRSNKCEWRPTQLLSLRFFFTPR